MQIKDLRRDWDACARNDPLWAIITHPGKRGNKWDVSEFFRTGVAEIEGVLGYIQSLGVPLRRERALDFGCGVGRLTQAMADYFNEVHGVDVSPSMVELARRYNRHNEKCRYHANDSSSLGIFPNNHFDLVYSNITLQHIDPKDAMKYVQEFVRVLVPRGLLVFQLPSAPSNPLRAGLKHVIATRLLWLFRRLGYIRRPIMVMHGVRRESVVGVVQRAGARIIDIREDQSAGSDWQSYRYCATKA